jgi:hypothetical protein
MFLRFLALIALGGQIDHVGRMAICGPFLARFLCHVWQVHIINLTTCSQIRTSQIVAIAIILIIQNSPIFRVRFAGGS